MGVFLDFQYSSDIRHKVTKKNKKTYQMLYEIILAILKVPDGRKCYKRRKYELFFVDLNYSSNVALELKEICSMSWCMQAVI